MHDAVTVHMDAPPKQVWELVSDVTNTGRFSPETLEVRWMDGATEPAVGVRFRGRVRRNEWGPTYWSVCRVTACVPGEEFGFDVLGPNGDVLNTWHYRFEPAGEGTDVTESYRLPSNPLLDAYAATLGRARRRYNRRNLETTLHRIRAEVEGTEPPPATARGNTRTLRVQDEVVVDATPELVWALVADPTRIAAFSPENTGAVTPVDGPLGVGDRFVGHNRRGPGRWSTECEVIASDPGARFAFTVDRIGTPTRLVPVRIATWDYRFEAVEGGTRVTEIWTDGRGWPDLLTYPFDWIATGGTTFAEFQRGNIRRSLGRLRELVASGAAGS